MLVLTMADIYRYQHKHYELPQPEHTLGELRAMLRGKTWEDVVNESLTKFGNGGVHFTARMGMFLCRKAIAVCACNKLVAMRFVEPSNVHPVWTYNGVLDGNSLGCFAIIQGDFIAGRLGDVKLTDLVIPEGED